MTSNIQHYDAMVIGGGITGLQTAIDLGDQGYQVALVEKEASIGGKMIMLSKVFPTLDCCSCITTPRMAAAANHDNVHLLAYSEVQSMERNGGGFLVNVLQKPRYIDTNLCTGCRQCEYVCPIDLPDAFDLNMGAHRAVYVPYSTAMPQKALIDIDNCLFCGKCEKACPAEAIDFSQRAEELQLEIDTIVLATGFETTPRDAKKEYGAGKLLNVVDGMQVERMLAPTGPFGHVLRPGDGKQPESIAYVQCAGSRDQTLGVDYCSRVCCMYAIKQGMLLSGALPLAEITVYYMDIRTFGKGYEEFYQNAKAMGIEFIKGKVARITEDEDHNPIVRVELIDEGSRVVERTHDMVVLSVGMQPSWNPQAVFGVPVGRDGFIHIPEPNLFPCRTDQPGIFAAGTAAGPMDIVDSIVMGSAAASEAAAYIQSQRSLQTIQTANIPGSGERIASYA